MMNEKSHQGRSSAVEVGKGRLTEDVTTLIRNSKVPPRMGATMKRITSDMPSLAVMRKPLVVDANRMSSPRRKRSHQRARSRAPKESFSTYGRSIIGANNEVASPNLQSTMQSDPMGIGLCVMSNQFRANHI
jgi:hypothetical protein